MDKAREILRGQKAQTLLNDPLLVEAFEDVHADIITGLEKSEFADVEIREDAYRMLRALESLKGKLERYVRKAKGLQAEDEELARSVPRLAETKE